MFTDAIGDAIFLQSGYVAFRAIPAGGAGDLAHYAGKPSVMGEHEIGDPPAGIIPVAIDSTELIIL